MVLIPPSPTGQYINTVDLNLYNSSKCQGLATQASAGRYFKLLSPTPVDSALQVYLCEDGYTPWISTLDLPFLEPVTEAYQPQWFNRSQIEAYLPDIIAFTQAAMAYPNEYLWGGTIAPNYDCSGLIQAAFSASGIWLPRDSYQQESFTDKISQGELQAGDLIFFGRQKVDHVALYLGDGKYIHSSGKKEGRNGIAIDYLSPEGDSISQHYYSKLWGFGRVNKSLIPDCADIIAIT